MRRVFRRIAAAFGILLLALVLLVTGLFVYPLGSDRAQQAQVKSMSFEAAQAAGKAAVQRDVADSSVQTECRTKLLTHPGRAAKSVLMLHGYTSCPKDYDQLAQLFFDRGYNVYVPREPHHGLDNKQATADVTLDGLLDYSDGAMDIAAGLGAETGVIGISGGAVLATWLAQYRTESVAHLLTLSPFYQPGPTQAPTIAVKPITVLFGFHLVPDRINERGFSFAALAQYLRIVRNYPDRPVNDKLASVAVVRAADDPLIDLNKAYALSDRIASVNGLAALEHEFPASFKLEHAIVGSENLGTRSDAIDNFYLNLYEGRQTPPPT